MNRKKSPKADLEKKRFAFFHIGLILSGAICLAAFEYTTLRFSDIEPTAQIEEVDILTNEIPKEVVFKAAAQQPKPKITIIDLGVNEKEEIDPIVNQNQTSTIEIDPDLLNNLLNSNTTNSTFVGKKFDTLLVAEKMPEFPGGEAAMRNWIAKHIKLPEYGYPAAGTIYVSFVVNTRGEVVNVTLAKGIERDYDRAALAVIQSMPKWTPGEQAGKPVPVQFSVPINVKQQ